MTRTEQRAKAHIKTATEHLEIGESFQIGVVTSKTRMGLCASIYNYAQEKIACASGYGYDQESEALALVLQYLGDNLDAEREIRRTAGRGFSHIEHDLPNHSRYSIKEVYHGRNENGYRVTRVK